MNFTFQMLKRWKEKAKKEREETSQKETKKKQRNTKSTDVKDETESPRKKPKESPKKTEKKHKTEQSDKNEEEQRDKRLSSEKKEQKENIEGEEQLESKKEPSETPVKSLSRRSQSRSPKKSPKYEISPKRRNVLYEDTILLNESMEILSPEKTPKLIPECQLTEDFFRKELDELLETYNYALHKSQKRGFDFFNSSRGWPTVLSALEDIRQKIGNEFVPKSKTDHHQIFLTEIDRNMEEYFNYVKDFPRGLRAIKTPRNGQCLPEAINLALNGKEDSQVYEMRLRAAVLYGEHFEAIHSFGSIIGWANPYGKSNSNSDTIFIFPVVNLYESI